MKIFKFLIDLFYPYKCVFCETVLKDTDICRDCEKDLPYTKGDSTIQKFPFIKKCLSPLYYKDNVRDAVLRYKFFGNESYSIRFGIIMADCIENNLDCGSIDVISWVPLSRKRLRKRGYNQSRLLAKEISARVDVPCGETLKKIRNNPAQSGIRDKDARAKNVVGAYEVAADVKGKYVLLIDDVVTTGATLSECARMLVKAGAKEVYAATLARRDG